MSGLPGGHLFNRFFQVAYATNDFERALKTFDREFGVKDALLMKDIPFGPGVKLNVALAYVGDNMVELIEPNGEGNTIYNNWVPAEPFTIRVHHIGHLVRDTAEWDAVMAGLAARGHKIVVDNDRNGFHYVFADVRHITGHYNEYIHCSDEGRRLLDRIPRN